MIRTPKSGQIIKRPSPLFGVTFLQKEEIMSKLTDSETKHSNDPKDCQPVAIILFKYENSVIQRDRSLSLGEKEFPQRQISKI
jgi:hypothetical protein